MKMTPRGQQSEHRIPTTLHNTHLYGVIFLFEVVSLIYLSYFLRLSSLLGKFSFSKQSSKIANFCHTESCRTKKWGRILPEPHLCCQMQSSYVVRRLATSRDVYEANWNRRTDGQDYVLSQADALNKKLPELQHLYKISTIFKRKFSNIEQKCFSLSFIILRLKHNNFEPRFEVFSQSAAQACQLSTSSDLRLQSVLLAKFTSSWGPYN